MKQERSMERGIDGTKEKANTGEDQAIKISDEELTKIKKLRFCCFI